MNDIGVQQVIAKVIYPTKSNRNDIDCRISEKLIVGLFKPKSIVIYSHFICCDN